MIRKLMTSLERRIYGSGSFHVEVRATQALLKFCDEHKCSDPTLVHVRACLTALEAGELSNAVAAFEHIGMHKEGLHEWWPPAVFSNGDETYAWTVFEALFERWYRLMNQITSRKH